MSKDRHSFSVEVAKKYSMDVAAFLESIAYWIHLNMANNKHFYEGRYWTRNTLDAFSVIFPYWTPRQLERVIKTCIKNGLLIKGNFNKHQYDRTCWYTLSDLGLELYNYPISPNGEMEKTERGNAVRQTVTTIPITNTGTNTITKNSCSSSDERGSEEEESFILFWEAYPRKEAKKDARKAWSKIKQKEYAQIISDLMLRKDKNWKGKAVQFIPLPASYLNGKRWNDEIFDNQEGNNHATTQAGSRSYRNEGLDISRREYMESLERRKNRAQ